MHRPLFHALALTCATVLFSNCAAPPRGGAPSKPTADARTGTLTVFTASAWHTDAEGEEAYMHSPYQILRPDGHFVRHVENQAGLDEGEPERVRLPAGRYVIAGQASGTGSVKLPVEVGAGEDRVVHLDQKVMRWADR